VLFAISVGEASWTVRVRGISRHKWRGRWEYSGSMADEEFVCKGQKKISGGKKGASINSYRRGTAGRRRIDLQKKTT